MEAKVRWLFSSLVLLLTVSTGRPLDKRLEEGGHPLETTVPPLKDIKPPTGPSNPTTKKLDTVVVPTSNGTRQEGVIVGLEGQGKLSLHEVTVAHPPPSIVQEKSDGNAEKGKIHARKGVKFEEAPPVDHAEDAADTNRTYAVETEPHKPLLTVDSDGDTEENRESFIESSTTGRDFIFPMVLGILIFPLVVLLVRFLYKRGSEFSERQQYRRMYLIDGGQRCLNG